MINKTEVQLQEDLIKEHLRKLNLAEKRFIPFVKHVWPEFIEGDHHRKIAKKFEDIAKKYVNSPYGNYLKKILRENK